MALVRRCISGNQVTRFFSFDPVKEVATQDTFSVSALSGNNDHASRSTTLLSRKELWQSPPRIFLIKPMQVKRGGYRLLSPPDPAFILAILHLGGLRL